MLVPIKVISNWGRTAANSNYTEIYIDLKSITVVQKLQQENRMSQHNPGGLNYPEGMCPHIVLINGSKYWLDMPFAEFLKWYSVESTKSAAPKNYKFASGGNV